MGLVRKYALSQILSVYDDYKKVCKPTLEVETTFDYPPEHEDHRSGDMDYDDGYNQSNKIIGTYGMGNFGETYGDVTNKGHYANLLSVSNPLDRPEISSYEDFGDLHGFGDFWVYRDPNGVQKFDMSDKDMLSHQGAGDWSATQKVVGHGTSKQKISKIKESTEYIETKLKYIKSFNDFNI